MASELNLKSFSISLTHLHHTNPALFDEVLNDVHNASVKWSNVLLDLQKRFAETDEFLDPHWEIKVNGRVRFINLPEQDPRNRSVFPVGVDVGKFVQIKGKHIDSLDVCKQFSSMKQNLNSGTVLRATQPKFLEYKINYVCKHCKATIVVEGEYAKYYVVVPPNGCPNACKGTPYSDTTNVDNENFITYQEIKIMVRRTRSFYYNFTVEIRVKAKI